MEMMAWPALDQHERALQLPSGSGLAVGNILYIPRRRDINVNLVSII